MVGGSNPPAATIYIKGLASKTVALRALCECAGMQWDSRRAGHPGIVGEVLSKSGIAAKELINTEALCQTWWRPFDREPGHRQMHVGTGRAARPRVDTFSQNWLTRRTG